MRSWHWLTPLSPYITAATFPARFLQAEEEATRLRAELEQLRTRGAQETAALIGDARREMEQRIAAKAAEAQAQSGQSSLAELPEPAAVPLLIPKPTRIAPLERDPEEELQALANKVHRAELSLSERQAEVEKEARRELLSAETTATLRAIIGAASSNVGDASEPLGSPSASRWRNEGGPTPRKPWPPFSRIAHWAPA